MTTNTALNPIWCVAFGTAVALSACGGPLEDEGNLEIESELKTRYREAEWSAANNAFEMVNRSGASAGKVVRVKPGTRRNDNPNARVGAAVGEMRFRFPAGNLSANRNQYFWIRYKAANQGSNSFYVKREGGNYVQKSVPIGSGYQWFNTQISARSNGSGVATFYVKNREANIELDRIYATDDPNVGPGSVAPPPPPPPPPTPPPAVGVRTTRVIGIKSWRRMALDKPKRGWATTAWNGGIGEAFNTYPCAFTEHAPAIVARVRWSDAYINSNIKPTRAQARNPNWSNYVWNRAESSANDFVYDGVTDALNSPHIRNGNGPGRLMISVALSSTSNILSPPVWMRNDARLAWLEPRNNNGAVGNWHVRFDNTNAVNHAADFMEALLKKYGNNRGVHSVVLGEYWLGPANTIPSGLSRSRYIDGVKDLWVKVAQAAPRDSNGKRVLLFQTSPMDADRVLDDLNAAGFGLSQSDTYFNLPVAGSPSASMRRAYDLGMPTAMQGDSRYARIGRRQRWDGTSNPFGHRSGRFAVITPQELWWYHGEKGPVPIESIMMSLSDYVPNQPQRRSNFFDAIRRFGRCGTQAAQWGPAPSDR